MMNCTEYNASTVGGGVYGACTSVVLGLGDWWSSKELRKTEHC